MLARLKSHKLLYVVHIFAKRYLGLERCFLLHISVLLQQKNQFEGILPIKKRIRVCVSLASSQKNRRVAKELKFVGYWLFGLQEREFSQNDPLGRYGPARLQ